MPLDFATTDLLPENINFPVEFEPTKFNKSKYVINGNTGEYLGIVGRSFPKNPHGAFFTKIYDAIANSEYLGDEFCASMDTSFKTARNNAWVMMDMIMPNVTRRIESNKHSTTIAPRLIALHGIDGSCSNQVYFGSIDFFCTNGMVTGEYNKLKKKNSSNFDLDIFIEELKETVSDFNTSADQYQKWAETYLVASNVKDMLETIMSSSRAKKMYSLYNQEASVRGQNAWALYSAFTNYASHQNEENGFVVKNTGNDTEAETMWKREHDVSKWTSTPQFKQLVAA